MRKELKNRDKNYCESGPMDYISQGNGVNALMRSGILASIGRSTPVCIQKSIF